MKKAFLPLLSIFLCLPAYALDYYIVGSDGAKDFELTPTNMTEKATPATGDYIIVYDTADSDKMKKANWSSLPAGGGGGGSGGGNMSVYNPLTETKNYMPYIIHQASGYLTLTGAFDKDDVALISQDLQFITATSATNENVTNTFMPFSTYDDDEDGEIDQAASPDPEWNGTFIESFNAYVTVSGDNVRLTLTAATYGDLTMRFSTGHTTLDCYPEHCAVALSSNTDTEPQENFVYILQSDLTLTASPEGFPTAEHIKVGYFLVPSPSYVKGEGAYINQNWNDHQTDGNDQGHITHMAERSRRLGAIYYSGFGGGAGGEYLNIDPPNVWLKIDSGIIYQMHKHSMSAIDTEISGDFHVVNSPTTAFLGGEDLAATIVELSDGTELIPNKHFNLALWMVGNKSNQYHPVMINLPSCYYTQQADAESDVDGCDDLTMPREFTVESSTGFLIARLTIKYGAGGSWVLESTTDLRGQNQFSAGGGSSGGVVHEFSDEQFRTYDDGDNTKVFRTQNSGASAYTTQYLQLTNSADRWADLPDKTGTLAMIGDFAFITGTYITQVTQSGRPFIFTSASSETIPTSATYGGLVVLSTDDFWTLPAKVNGMMFNVLSSDATAKTIDVNGADQIFIQGLGGPGAITAGNAIDFGGVGSPGTEISFLAAGAYWYVKPVSATIVDGGST